MRGAVNKYSVEKTEEYKGKLGHSGCKHVGQMPKHECYFDKCKRLYLNPGVKMPSVDPLSIPTSAAYSQTKIRWCHGKNNFHIIYFMTWIKGYERIKQTYIVREVGL